MLLDRVQPHEAPCFDERFEGVRQAFLHLDSKCLHGCRWEFVGGPIVFPERDQLFDGMGDHGVQGFHLLAIETATSIGGPKSLAGVGELDSSCTALRAEVLPVVEVSAESRVAGGAPASPVRRRPPGGRRLDLPYGGGRVLRFSGRHWPGPSLSSGFV